MRRLYEEILNPKSMVILPEYDENGYLNSRVHHTEGSSIIHKTPLNVIKNTLTYYVNDLEGALRASKNLLGSHRMLPIVICESLDMYWFPTESSKNERCIWLALKYIEDIIPLDGSSCMVVFINGLSIEMKMKARRLRSKWDLTAKLKVKTEDRKRMIIPYVSSYNKGFMYVNESNRDFYKIGLMDKD